LKWTATERKKAWFCGYKRTGGQPMGDGTSSKI
jgi:hypothetical protein